MMEKHEESCSLFLSIYNTIHHAQSMFSALYCGSWKKKKYSVQLHLEKERKKECMYESVSMKKKKNYAGCQDDKILT